MAATSEELSGQTKQMRRTVDVFRLPESVARSHQRPEPAMGSH